jgi:RNA polymerase sigma-70 factor (ECF subfamily)
MQTLSRPKSVAAKVVRRRRPARWLSDPEVALMLRVADGDEVAFGELAGRYTPRVFGHFCHQLGDRAEAEDLTQEVFLRLYRSRLRYRPQASFSTWMFHIAQNVLRNALRTRRRRPCMRLDLAHGTDAERSPALSRSDCTDSPSRPLERSELADVVRAAVSELAGRQRKAVELHQFEDRTYAEVAAKLRMTPKAAKSLLYRARNHLRDRLTGFMQ